MMNRRTAIKHLGGAASALLLAETLPAERAFCRPGTGRSTRGRSHRPFYAACFALRL